MRTFFIVAQSFAAPVVSDRSEAYVEAETARAALEKFAEGYGHPSGLYGAAAWHSHRDYHERRRPIAEYKSNRLIAEEQATAGKPAYSFSGYGPDSFRIDGKLITVENPKEGKVVA